jgi:hypothetical protein
MSDEKEIEKKVNLEGFAASVELPEGHQLVLGELPPGTVVEVATWQGTGRPDETTNRFLLSASGSGLQRRTRNSKTQEENVSAQPQIEAPSRREQSSGSIGAGSSYLGMKTFGVDSAPIEKPKSNVWARIGRSIFFIVSIVAIISLVLSLLGISAVVPSRGAKTALGSSTQALVVYKKTPSVEIGAPTVAQVQDGETLITIFGPSNSFDSDIFQIETTAGQELVSRTRVQGRAFLAIPLLGILVKPLFG